MEKDFQKYSKKYKIILADPPWHYKDQGCQGTMKNHYHGIKIEDLKKIPVKSIADKDCVLFMWATYPFLREALELIESWGFVYKTIAFVWIKRNRTGNGYFFGLGRWTRGNAEPCLLATIGKPRRIHNNISQLIFDPITKHSRKPEEVNYKIVELLGDIPRIELFARRKINGWDAIGYDFDRMDINDSIKLLINGYK